MGEQQGSDLRLSHFGVCVTDLERSLRFYCDGLDFEKAEGFDVGNEYGPSLEVDGDVRLRSQFIRRQDIAIELMEYQSPGTIGEPSQHRNQVGLTHLSFYVDDLDGAIARLVQFGGSVIERTRADNPGIALIFCADPDGTRVELMKQG